MESPIKVNKEFEEAVKNARSPEDLILLCHSEAVAQHLVPESVLGYREDWDPKPAAAAPAKKFERTENIGGTDFNFSATSQVELEKLIADARTVAEAVQSDPNSPAVRGRADEEKARKAELELRFKRNEISVDQYLEESGAVDHFLADRGIPVEAIEETVAEKERKSWEQASAEFAHSAEGADWPGGEKQLEVLAMTVTALGLAKTDDPLSALKVAWAQCKKDGLLFKEDGSPAGGAGGSGGAGASVTAEDWANADSYEQLHELARRSVGQDPSDAAHSRAWIGR